MKTIHTIFLILLSPLAFGNFVECKPDFIHIQEEIALGDYVQVEAFYMNASNTHGYFKSKIETKSRKTIKTHNNHERPTRITVEGINTIANKLQQMGYFEIKGSEQKLLDTGIDTDYYLVSKLRTKCKEKWTYFYNINEAREFKKIRDYLFSTVSFKGRM